MDRNQIESHKVIRIPNRLKISLPHISRTSIIAILILIAIAKEMCINSKYYRNESL